MDHYALKQLHLFADLEDTVLRRLAPQAQSRHFAVHETVFSQNQNDRADLVYFVLRGRVRITLYSPQGREVSFVDVPAGDCFGELAALDRQSRSASATCLEDSVLVWVSGAVFRSWLREHPTLTEATMRHLCAMVRRLSDRVFEFSTMVATSRVHAELLRMAETSRRSGGGPIEIHPAPTHLEIANRIGTQRETVSRELSELARAGVIERGRGRLVINDLAQLTALVEQATRRGDHA